MHRLLALFLLMVLSAGAAAQEPSRVGRVAAVQGELRAGDGLEARPILAGAPLAAGDRLATVGPSRALVQLDGGLVLSLGANTELTVAAAGPPAADGLVRYVLDLAKGIVRAVLRPGPAGGEATISTPLAVTSVRSTELTVEQRAAGTAVFVRSGTATVAAAGTAVVLGPGDGTDIAPGAAPTPVHAWGAARIADTLARSTLGR